MKFSLAVLVAALAASPVVVGKKATAAGGLRGGEEGKERKLTANECGEIDQWKVYTPGTPSRWPVPKTAGLGEPGAFFRIFEGACYHPSLFRNYNIMMYSTGEGYGESDCINYPACGHIKLWSHQTQRHVIRSGKDTNWPWFLTGDTPCYKGTAEVGHVNQTGMCNPSAKINNANPTVNANLAEGWYVLFGDLFSNCEGTLQFPGDLDFEVITFRVSSYCNVTEVPPPPPRHV